MKNKTNLVIAIIFLLFAVTLIVFLYQQRTPKNSSTSTPNTTSTTKSAQPEYMLDDYPLETVPLYKSEYVSSIKFFVNDDPASFADYFGKPVNYYNVVFKTEAAPDEFLTYYASLMSEKNESFAPDSQVEGKIGKYKVSASHYGDNPDNYGYLQVYIPTEEYQETNRYFDEYPSIVEIQTNWPEYENSYGLLNQKGGEVEYTQYFSMPENIDEQIEQYQAKHQESPEYNFNAETGLMTWKSGEYTVYLTFSKDHGRVYLMMRRPM